MQEAVRAEIVKLLDNGIVYPIYDSQWVSPVHAVPKKSDFIVVENKNQELVYTWLPMIEPNLHTEKDRSLEQC